MPQSQIGLIGLAVMGENLALNVESLKAAVICYGRLVTENEQLKKIACPLLLINGARDRGIPPSAVEEFATKATSLGKDVSYVIYEDAGHAFMNPNNSPGYRLKDANDAWKRIYDFLSLHLKKD